MMKKILYVHHGKGLGGAPISLVNLVKGVATAGFKPVVAFLHDSAAVELFREAGLEILPPLNVMDFSHTKIYWYRWYHLHHIARSLIDTIKTIFVLAPRVLMQVQPDIIHLNTSSLIGWAIAAKFKKIPVVWHIREPLADGYFGIRKALVRIAIEKLATKIVAICKADGQPWATSEKLEVVYNAVNEVQFIGNKATDKKTIPPTILFLGGLSEQKGSLFLLQILERLVVEMSTIRLILAGNTNCNFTSKNPLKKISPERSYIDVCQKLIQKLSGSIMLSGATTKVPLLFEQAHLLVFPASVDHFARPVIEAGFMHTPVIASDHEHLRELIINNKTGYLLPYGDQEIWIEKIKKILTSQELQLEMGDAAYTFCLAHFSLKNQVEKITQLYTGIVTGEK